ERLQLRLVAVVLLVDLLERFLGLGLRLLEAGDLGLRGVPLGLPGLDRDLAFLVEAPQLLVRGPRLVRGAALRVLLLLGLEEVAGGVHLRLPRAVELVRVVPAPLGALRPGLALRERGPVPPDLARPLALLREVLLLFRRVDLLRRGLERRLRAEAVVA